MTLGQPLEYESLAQALGSLACRFDVELLDRCNSTNDSLLARAEAGAPGGTVVVAAEQTAGRGRRGRPWISAPTDSLTFSLLWRFMAGTSPAGLSLAAGLAVCRGLDKVGAGGTVLKWPNDILLGGRKLGGLLIELVPGMPHAAVIGLGLNLRRPAGLQEEVRRDSAALDIDVDRNRLLGALLVELHAVLERFAEVGFAGLREAWQARHAYQDRPVRLLSDFAPPREGLCRGVDASGALLFETGGHVEPILSGEISLRGV